MATTDDDSGMAVDLDITAADVLAAPDAELRQAIWDHPLEVAVLLTTGALDDAQNLVEVQTLVRDRARAMRKRAVVKQLQRKGT